MARIAISGASGNVVQVLLKGFVRSERFPSCRVDDDRLRSSRRSGRPTATGLVLRYHETAAGEAMGSYYAARHEIEVINVRIGWLMMRDDLEDTQGADESEGARRFARSMWLSPRNSRQIMERAATESIPDTQLTVHGISRNDERFLSLTQTLQVLNYQPRAMRPK